MKTTTHPAFLDEFIHDGYPSYDSDFRPTCIICAGSRPDDNDLRCVRHRPELQDAIRARAELTARRRSLLAGLVERLRVHGN